jgi:hypothetical protein
MDFLARSKTKVKMSKVKMPRVTMIVGSDISGLATKAEQKNYSVNGDGDLPYF